MSHALSVLLLKLRNRHFLAVDVLVFLVTPALALTLRTDHIMPLFTHHTSLAVTTVCFLTIKIAAFYVTGLYWLYWRYAGIDELARIGIGGVIAVLTQTLAFFALLKLGWVMPDFPRSVPLIDGMLALLSVGAVRYGVRAAELLRQRTHSSAAAKRVLVVGAGRAGITIISEMRNKPQLELLPMGFVDDDPRKQNAIIHGLRVLGQCKDIPHLLRKHEVGLVVIAVPNAPGKVVREITAICDSAGAQTKIIPGIDNLLDGKVRVSQLRNVQIEDLLRRHTVQTDTGAVRKLIHGRRVLITGGGGSIGSELCRQVLRFGPAELVLVGHGENSIFGIHNELQHLAAAKATGQTETTTLHAVIADIRMPERLLAVFSRHQPEIVFHAAAHKHVPLMEANPSEAVTNNIIGTRNLLDVAVATGVEHFVMISTDKAVNPTSIMGASKRVAELLVHHTARHSGRPYVAVRFGNVLGSRGSVVLTFKEQIDRGGPVTVTHPDMRRYFMTIPEAVQLTLQAAAIGNGGEVFTLDMGEPIRIVDLARDMIELSGLEVGRDIDIVFTGVRPGEKLYEELFVAGEDFHRTVHEKIFIAGNASSFVPLLLHESVSALEQAAQRGDTAAIYRLIRGLIPQFSVPATEKPKESTVAVEPLRARVVGAD